MSAKRKGQTMTAQDNWRWCNKCQVLAFAGFPSLGACAAGGSHDHSGSGDYVLIQDVPVGGNQQERCGDGCGGEGGGAAFTFASNQVLCGG